MCYRVSRATPPLAPCPLLGGKRFPSVSLREGGGTAEQSRAEAQLPRPTQQMVLWKHMRPEVTLHWALLTEAIVMLKKIISEENEVVFLA